MSQNGDQQDASQGGPTSPNTNPVEAATTSSPMKPMDNNNNNNNNGGGYGMGYNNNNNFGGGGFKGGKKGGKKGKGKGGKGGYNNYGNNYNDGGYGDDGGRGMKRPRDDDNFGGDRSRPRRNPQLLELSEAQITELFNHTYYGRLRVRNGGTNFGFIDCTRLKEASLKRNIFAHSNECQGTSLPAHNSAVEFRLKYGRDSNLCATEVRFVTDQEAEGQGAKLPDCIPEGSDDRAPTHGHGGGGGGGYGGGFGRTYQGAVKNVRPNSSYGFIDGEGAGLEKDVFFHVTDVNTPMSELEQGMTVSFQISKNKDGQPQAKNVRVVGGQVPPPPPNMQNMPYQMQQQPQQQQPQQQQQLGADPNSQMMAALLQMMQPQQQQQVQQQQQQQQQQQAAATMQMLSALGGAQQQPQQQPAQQQPQAQPQQQQQPQNVAAAAALLQLAASDPSAMMMVQQMQQQQQAPRY